ncbi:MAG: tRNA epoxyqueuosine(34) reductase QueG [Myxococcales bacterium]|nr:tRNA epoxyqueuosine(34) reductase QueG [Myxococcales bacterium]|tara:strand:+ start:610 stop:1563 length:954 start_codon:yes stop_codon:yes gene_type:complete
MTPTQERKHLTDLALNLDFDDVGFASATDGTPHSDHFLAAVEAGHLAPLDYMQDTAAARADIQALMPGAKTVMVVVKNYFTGHHQHHSVSDLEEPNAKVSRYAWGRDYHQWMRKRLRKLRKSILAYSEDTEREVRIFSDTSPVLERAWAQKAGLGFVGKSAMFIHRKMGTWTFLGGVVLSWDVVPDAPVVSQFCGTCTKCMDHCPTQAFVGPGQLDARRCITTWNVERPLVAEADHAPGEGSGWGFGCDVCQEVCPWNKFETTTNEARFQPQAGHVWLAESLADLPEDLSGTAFARAKRVGVQRSVQRALKRGKGQS